MPLSSDIMILARATVPTLVLGYAKGTRIIHPTNSVPVSRIRTYAVLRNYWHTVLYGTAEEGRGSLWRTARGCKVAVKACPVDRDEDRGIRWSGEESKVDKEDDANPLLYGKTEWSGEQTARQTLE
ncbi:hypothetical protein KM043_014120 [Ampulex compressa]|nr:hypothetical protein KM043_014120 [Ampulex compressa]